MFSPSTEYAQSRPFKIFISLLDKWEIGSALTEVLVLDSTRQKTLVRSRHVGSRSMGEQKDSPQRVMSISQTTSQVQVILCDKCKRYEFLLWAAGAIVTARDHNPTTKKLEPMPVLPGDYRGSNWHASRV